jgi:hypothetical protein
MPCAETAGAQEGVSALAEFLRAEGAKKANDAESQP